MRGEGFQCYRCKEIMDAFEASNHACSEAKPLDQEAREIIVKHALWDAGLSGEQSAERGPVMLKVFELIEAARKEGSAAAQAELKNERLWKEHYKESAKALAGETIRLGELLKVAEDALAEIVATISRRKWIDQDGTALDTAEETLSRLRAGDTVKDEEC